MNKDMNDFNNYLSNIKGYSKLTIKLYLKFALQLINNNYDYKLVIEKYSKSSNSTKRIILSAIKKYYLFIGDNRVNEIVLPKKEIKLMNYINYHEYLSILNFISNNKNKKSKIIIRLLFETGIRSSELLKITIKDIGRYEIKIHGKNHKERIIYLSNSLYVELLEYIYENKIKNKLFNFKYKNLYKKISNLSPIISKKISPHSFRRGFASYCITKNISIFDLSLMMGHNSIETTKRYIYAYNYSEKMRNLFN